MHGMCDVTVACRFSPLTRLTVPGRAAEIKFFVTYEPNQKPATSFALLASTRQLSFLLRNLFFGNQNPTSEGSSLNGLQLGHLVAVIILDLILVHRLGDVGELFLVLGPVRDVVREYVGSGVLQVESDVVSCCSGIQ